MPGSHYAVLIVDDHPAIRLALHHLLGKPGGPTLYEAADPNQALFLTSRYKPDIVILDLTFPDLDGMEFIAKIRRACPNSEVLIFTMHVLPEVAQKAIREGARGFVTKLDPLSDLVAAINAVRTRQFFLSHQITHLSAMASSLKPQEADQLSSRELEIVKALARGKSNREIAAELRLSMRTIEFYRARVMRKMKFKNTSELIRFAIRMGWIEK